MPRSGEPAPAPSGPASPSPGRPASLPVLEHVLVAQLPVLPELQGREQHDQRAEGGMVEAEQAVAMIAEHIGREKEPEPGDDASDLLPALQRDIFKLREAEHDEADHHGVEDDNAPSSVSHLTLLRRKPWGKGNQQAEQHAAPIFPGSMLIKKIDVRHGKPPFTRGIRQRPDGMTFRLSGDRSGRIRGRMSMLFDLGTAGTLASPGSTIFCCAPQYC